MAGNRANTTAAYESAWGKWADWCVGKGADPLCANLACVLEFLADLHASGKSYRTINVHRSMLSKTLSTIEGVSIEEHPLVVRFLRGCYNANPPGPKYSAIWDPDQVLRFIVSIGENQHLSLINLTCKMVTLVALATLMRVSEIASISFGTINFAENFAFVKISL
jgi:hypothetical protein